jgi:PPOX class probable F420-dependent enzyme
MIFESGSDADRHALERLEADMIGWLTSVTPDGQPQSFPVWFLWQDGEILVYSDYRAKRNANIAANPKVSLHLQATTGGGDVVVVEGVARVDPDAPGPKADTAYLAKYGAWIDGDMGGIDVFAATWNVPIRITPTRGRASGA